MRKILELFFGKKDKKKKMPDTEPVKVKPQKPITGNLTYKGKSLSETKRIIHRQQAKSTEDFNKRVGECTKWIDTSLGYAMINHGIIYAKVRNSDKKELLALKVALSKHRHASHGLGRTLGNIINDELKKRGHNYILRAGKR